jgi:hypothetical protein
MHGHGPKPEPSNRSSVQEGVGFSRHAKAGAAQPPVGLTGASTFKRRQGCGMLGGAETLGGRPNPTRLPATAATTTWGGGGRSGGVAGPTRCARGSLSKLRRASSGGDRAHGLYLVHLGPGSTFD